MFTLFDCVGHREGGAHLHTFSTPNFSLKQIEKSRCLLEVRVTEDSKLKRDKLPSPLFFF